METGLHAVRLGIASVVTKIDTVPALQQRLRDFGLVPGTNVVCCYRNPGGQVTAVAFKGTVVALRTRDLQKIRVEH